MKVSEHWLREWVDPDVSSQEIATVLTMAGLEVDSIEPAAGIFSGVVIGCITEVTQHPNADRLRCCKVDTGSAGGMLDIVCGGSNVRSNQMVPVAVVGAKLGEDFTIKKTKLRGEPSHGMICSSQELGLGDDGSGGILELPVEAPLGMDVREYLALDDVVFDIDLTPNRGDCLSIRGVAREVAIFHEQPLLLRDEEKIVAGCDDALSITLEAEQVCSRYAGRVVRGINSAAILPIWMIERLRRSGLRSIHPVVDILNYVMLEIGQPMHAFDFAKLSGDIVVRSAQQGETLLLLDGLEVTLAAADVVIADSSSPIAIAGVMGGLSSSVTDETVDVFLESAYFEPIGLAKTARRLGLQTDACYRYTRGVDYQLQEEAIERATQLLIKYVGGSAGPVVLQESVDYLPRVEKIELRYERIERVLGIDIQREVVVACLASLGMDVTESSEGWFVVPPSFRSDIKQEVDLIEEVARLYRFDQIPTRTQAVSFDFPEIAETEIVPLAIKQALMHMGYHEVVTYSFIDQKRAEIFSDAQSLIALANPLSSDMGTMRGSLWAGLIETLSYNQRRQCSRQCLFEVGRCFLRKGEEIEQPMHLGVLFSGARNPEQWGYSNELADFYDLKAHIDELIRLTGRSGDFNWRRERHCALHQGQSAALYEGDRRVGFLGALDPSLEREWGLHDPVYLCEVELAALSTAKIPVVNAVSKFPEVRRDLAFLFDNDVESDNILNIIRETAGSILRSVKIFDIYEGVECGLDKKSIALGLTFQAASRTLVDEEINQVVDNIMKALQKAFNATLRV